MDEKQMTADEVVGKMNKAMRARASDVSFFWSACQNNATNQNGQFLLWGYRISKFTRGNKGAIKSCFLYNIMADMLNDLIDRYGELDNLEKYVLDSIEE